LALSVGDRIKQVKKHKLCFCCLGKQHWSKECTSRKQCPIDGCTRYYPQAVA
jgi:hypothetical protein